MKIISTGSYLPPKILTNFDIEKKVNTNHDWIYSKLGINERRIAIDETTSDMGAKAAMKALKFANLMPSDIDLIIVATSTPDRLSPSTACIIQDKIKAFNSVAFDINAVCTGFIYALKIANSMLNSNSYKNILIIASEKYSSITDWDDRNCVFFGDGAGAVIVKKSKDSFFKCDLYADGRGKENFTVPGIGTEYELKTDLLDNKLHKFVMNGKAVYETGTKVLPNSINKILQNNDIDIKDISWLIPHQPSINILKETSKKIGLNFDKVVTVMDKYANIAGASIPIALDDLNSKNLIFNGQLILFAAVGSGWTWGSAILKW